ncbi:hypothetical protein EIP86_004419 [Pleurotus ostreatoroseus]|nr:hypothetical protein EIP86_004419 [Pleurotus ostreatoroseus]
MASVPVTLANMHPSAPPAYSANADTPHAVPPPLDGDDDVSLNGYAPAGAADADGPALPAATPEGPEHATGPTQAPSHALPPIHYPPPRANGNHAPVPPTFPALHTALYPEPALRGSVHIRVVPRCGIVGQSDKVEWRLYTMPPSPVGPGSRVALFDPLGSYRFLSRTVGPVIGVDQQWVTFVLSAGLSATATTQTLSIPREHSALPFLLRVLFFFLAHFLANEHPFTSTPLPDLD